MTAKSHPFVLIALGIVAAAWMGEALAQTSRYSSGWQNPSDQSPSQSVPGGSENMERMLRELGKLIDEAERARAADPRFLSDLRDLARRHAWPWRKRVAFDDFADGNISTGPAWRIIRGDFRVIAEQGLRTSYAPAAPQPASRDQQPMDDRDVGKALLKGLLQQMVKRDRQKPAQAPATPSGPSEIGLTAAIPNAFAVRLNLASPNAANGRLEFGVAQGNRTLGYRLAYNAGAQPSLDLLRVGSHGSSVIESVRLKARLDDGKSHALVMTRDNTGELAVTIDDKEVMRVIDRGFRDAFDSFVLVNRGGEYMIRSVAIYGG